MSEHSAACLSVATVPGGLIERAAIRLDLGVQP